MPIDLNLLGKSVMAPIKKAVKLGNNEEEYQLFAKQLDSLESDMRFAQGMAGVTMSKPFEEIQRLRKLGKQKILNNYGALGDLFKLGSSAAGTMMGTSLNGLLGSLKK